MKKLLLLLMLSSFPAYAANMMGSFETEDLQGTTTHFNGTVGTTTVAIPTVAANIIAEVLFRCPGQQAGIKKCLISFDGGTNFITLSEGEFIAWSLKGELKQVHVQGSAAGTSYEIIMNRESW